MHIHHAAIWTKDLEVMKEFYSKVFQGKASNKYVNPVKQFESYFIEYDSGASLELMRMPGIAEKAHDDLLQQMFGYTHLAFSVGSPEQVDLLTHELRSQGYSVVGEPRRTGDGHYESVILDPEGNRVEILA